MYYSKIAKGYNSLHGEEQLNKLKIIAKILKVTKETSLLDVGCGTGISTYYFDCDCTGLDPCKELIEQNPSKLILGRAEELPFENDSFDVVISVTAIHNFEDYRKGLEEMYRVSKNGGQVALSILRKANDFEKISSLINEIFGEVQQIEESKDIIFYNTNLFKRA
jgi:ubiquinone/menaquinone biosynthesis C-methylase UbiE